MTAPYRDDPEEEYPQTSIDTEGIRPSSTARHIELTQRTNELLSNFGNFLNELGSPDGDDQPPSSLNNVNSEFNSATALQTPRGGSGGSVYSDDGSYQRSYTDRHDDVSYEPASGEPNLWNTNNLYSYDDDYNNGYGYDPNGKRRYRRLGGNNMAYVCTFGVVIALIVIAAVSIGKSRDVVPTTSTVVNNGKDTKKDAGGNDNDAGNEKEVAQEEKAKEIKDMLMNLDKSYMPQDPQMREQYLAVAEAFQPQWYNRQHGWEGQAYLQAYEFCNNVQDIAMQPCPYTAICPGGVGYPPYGGVRDSPLSSGSNSTMAWAPVKNVPNEWVQVSQSDDDDGQICQLYSSSHEGTPRWGLTGEYDEEMTRNILCCLLEENIMEQEPEIFSSIVHEISKLEQENESGSTDNDETILGSDVIARPPGLEEDQPGDMMETGSIPESSSSATTTKPAIADPRVPSDIAAFWYSRSDGWEGTAYQAAVDFCAFHNEKTICPFQIYCPEGPGGKPYAATAEQALLEYDSLFWSPVMNGLGEEAWAGIGNANLCVPPLKYPAVSPEMLYNATSFIMCCDMNVDNGKGQASSSSSNAESAQEMAAEMVGEVEEGFTESEFMTAARDVWNPQWFSSKDGWNGGSYVTAINFCEEKLEDGHLCPYQAICPNGLSTDPYMSSEIFSTKMSQWVPTRASVYSYILISNGNESDGSQTICDSYESVYGDPHPQIGTTEEMQDLKQFLLCCHPED
eukprot:scaffold386429_cov93-Cyclotella_meneghiniana.AAC.4